MFIMCYQISELYKEGSTNILSNVTEFIDSYCCRLYSLVVLDYKDEIPPENIHYIM